MQNAFIPLGFNAAHMNMNIVREQNDYSHEQDYSQRFSGGRESWNIDWILPYEMGHHWFMFQKVWKRVAEIRLSGMRLS